MSTTSDRNDLNLMTDEAKARQAEERNARMRDGETGEDVSATATPQH